jgi:CheY-like chemotaxis protein
VASVVAARQAPRALIAIAEPSSVRLCREVLEKDGFLVDTVDSGIGAVVAVRERLPHIILIDLQLRDVPGREAVGWLRSNPALQSTPIVIIGGAEESRVLVAPQPGAVLRKPLTPDAIRRAIGDLRRPAPESGGYP